MENRINGKKRWKHFQNSHVFTKHTKLLQPYLLALTVESNSSKLELKIILSHLHLFDSVLALLPLNSYCY